MRNEEQPKTTKQIKEFPPKQYAENGDPVFDNRVQIRDEHTGRLVKLQPYARHTMGSQVLFERPIGSGNMYDEKGQSLGNWEHIGEGQWVKKGEDHVAAKAHVDIYDAESGQAKISELEAEVAALKAERGEPQKQNGKA